MKKGFWFLAFAGMMTFSFVAAAQEPTTSPEEPKIFAEAGLGFGGCQGDCDNVDPFLGISVGGFFKLQPEIAVGANFRYQMYNIDSGDMSSVMLSAEGRYYFPISPVMKAYGAGALGWDRLSVKVDTPYGSGEGHDTAYFVQLGGGVEYALSPVMFVGGTLRFQLNFWDDNEGDFNDWLLAASFGYRF